MTLLTIQCNVNAMQCDVGQCNAYLLFDLSVLWCEKKRDGERWGRECGEERDKEMGREGEYMEVGLGT